MIRITGQMTPEGAAKAAKIRAWAWVVAASSLGAAGLDPRHPMVVARHPTT